MKTWNWMILAGLALAVTACGGGSNAEEQPNVAPPRNVVAKAITPQTLDIKIKLPVLVNPTETIELRAAVAGVIVDLPYNEGDVIPASAIPAATWTDEAAYVASRNGENGAAGDEELSLRNMLHLNGLACFAKVDGKHLLQSLTETQANYDSAVRALERAKKYSATTEAQLDAARTAKVQSRAAATRVIGNLQDTFVCNPRSGVLTKRFRQKGEFVGMGELLGTIAVIDPLKASVQIPEAHQKVLKKGDEVSIWLPSIDETRMAIVTRVAVVAHPTTHSFAVEMSIENTDMAIPGGIFGEVSISIYKIENAIVVPLTAIRLSGDQKFVYLEKNSIAREVPVRIGQISSAGAEVFSDALEAGDKLITVGAQWLADGDTVRATEVDPAEEMQR
ncbi:efflux RND transporter periplasmic adaptor subunit [Planctomycetota bacterium]|nr:efflux RND transporter periplasmic adaptor subunit [Planctomycetota bacterium]